MSEMDKFFKVLITKNGMEATLTQLKALTDEVSVSKEDLIQYLKENEVVFGIDENVIDEVIVSLQSDIALEDKVIVARGIEPIKGDDAYLVPIQFTKERVIDEKQLHVDLKKVIEIPNVTQEELIGEKIPATEGHPGTNVSGEEVPPKPGKDFILRKGKNTRISDDRLKIYAIVDGQMSVQGKVIHVYPIYEVNGDIDMKIGNIDFVGNVNIRGNVPTGFEIKAKGDIRIHGSVEGAVLDAGGSIYIQAGIVAQNRGMIRAKQDLHTTYINQGDIVVDGDIHVAQGILHSQCTAGGNIVCTSGKGTIVGGIISAGKNIELNEAGNSMGTVTSFYIGTHKQLLEKEKLLENQVADSKDELEKLEKLKKAYELKEKQGTPLTQQERITKLRIRSSVLLLNEKVKNSSEELKELQEELGSPEYGCISVLGTLYPNVNITFGKYSRRVTKNYRGVKVSFEEKEIKILSL